MLVVLLTERLVLVRLSRVRRWLGLRARADAAQKEAFSVSP
jgi:hypothetical protein